MKIHLNSALGSLAVVGMLAGTAACSEDVVPPEQPKENTIPGQEVGIRELKVSVPRLSRFDRVVDRFSCRIHLRGRRDRVEYPVNIFLSADKDSLYMEADDPILVELPHQMYHLNVITFTGKNITSRGEDDGMVREDTVYVGARLDIQDPNNIHFGSSFNVGANSIGSGTEDDPYIIASGDDFMTRIADPMTRGETHEGKFFEMTRNINLNTAAVAYGKGWEPAGHNNINGGSTDFNGTLDGCDNYIENLYCFTDAGCGGLFYSLGEHAYIHNLEMKRVMLNGYSDIGALASKSKKGCRIDSVEVNGTIEGRINIGGFIGSGDADFKSCISSVNINSEGGDEGQYIGGMIGTTSSASFVDCIRTGRMDISRAGYVGGYVGLGPKGKDNETVKFDHCYVCGYVSGWYIGGFAGSSNAEFTECHAGATLPLDSYAYTWDIFNRNNRMIPMPLEIESKAPLTGGFVGNSDKLILHGENSFAYSSPAKPNIVSSANNTGALAGSASYYGDPDAIFVSHAYVAYNGKNSVGDCTGGILGSGFFHSSATFVNHGNVIGDDQYTGGVVGRLGNVDKNVTLHFTNTGNVKGIDYVGGVIGLTNDPVRNAILINDGSVEATGDYAGGLFGACDALDLADGSRVGSSNGSLKISGKLGVGGITGSLVTNGDVPFRKYCPVYANIISTGGTAGGIAGNVFLNGMSKVNGLKIFEHHSPVKVSITVSGGDNAGGAIGWLTAKYGYADGDEVSLDKIDDRLQASITTSGNIAGGVVGRVVCGTDNNGFDRTGHIEIIVTNCHSFTEIKSTATGEVSGFGGIVGWYETDDGDMNHDIRIEKCSFHGRLSGPNMTAAGGILGQASACRVLKCYNAGRVDAVMSVGGIVGRISYDGYISDCFNMGEVPSASGRKWLAGILGQMEDKNSEDVTINACYNVGQTGWGIVGGEDKARIKRQNCYYLDTASNGDMKGDGTHGVSADKLRNEKYYGFNFFSIWEHHNGEAAPTLKGVPMFNEKLPLQK